MDSARPKLIWLGVVALGLLWPFVTDVVLVEYAGHVVPQVAKTILKSRSWSDHESYAYTMRVVNGTVFAVAVGLIFGVPLGVLAQRVSSWPVVFVTSVVIACIFWHLSGEYGPAGLYSEWLLPEYWFTLAFVLIVAAAISRWRSRHLSELHN